jgi:hypothetical protein
MAKPKFELTSDLVKVEPEPQSLLQQAIVVAEKVAELSSVAHPSYFTQPINKTPSDNFSNNQDFIPEIATMQHEAPAKPKEERQALNLLVSKNIKKQFHMHCVQNGLSMTEAIEVAIQKYLEGNQ